MGRRLVNSLTTAVIRAGEAAARWMMWLCIISLMIMMMITALDVFGRYFLNSPIPGALEFTEFLLVISVAAGLAYTQTTNGHIVVNLVVGRLPAGGRKFFLGLGHLICLVLYALITRQAVVGGLTQLRNSVTSGAFEIPLWPFYYFMALGCAVACLVFLSDLVKLFLHSDEVEAT